MSTTKPSLFSVLVPCHNPEPAQLLEALASVRSQLDGTHQIIVFDDCSADPSVCLEAARDFGTELVRSDEDLGGVRAHNACFSLAQNELVHVLHPDDWVLPGFYEAVAGNAAASPDATLYATGAVHVRADGRLLSMSRPLWLAEGSFPPLHEGNPLCVPSCVVRRDFVLAQGGWDERLWHTADWEFWIRCWKLGGSGGVCEIPWPLAAWRVHPANHSSRLARTGDNLRNYLTLAGVVRRYAPELVDDAKLRAYVAARARRQEAAYRQAGELCAAEENARLALLLESEEDGGPEHERLIIIDEALAAVPRDDGDPVHPGGAGVPEGRPGLQEQDGADVPDLQRDPRPAEVAGLPEGVRQREEGGGRLTAEKHPARVYLAAPHYGAIEPAAMPSIMFPGSRRCEVDVRSKGASLLAYNFNQFYCECLNGRASRGYTHFAMHHADVECQPDWLDVMLDEMDRVGADVLSVVIPIKDQRGLTSTGWRDRDTMGITRLTMREVMALSETFDAAGAGRPGCALMVNTGLLVFRLGMPWCERLHFEIRDCIVKLPDGRFQARVLPEDWNASGFFHSWGLRVFATRKLRAVHHGKMAYPNDRPWGEWTEDRGDDFCPLTADETAAASVTREEDAA